MGPYFYPICKPIYLHLLKTFFQFFPKTISEILLLQCKACVRERKFSLSSYLLGSLSKLCSSTRSPEFTLNDFHMNYNRNQVQPLKISHKCIHKQLDSDEALAVVKNIVEQSISLFSHKLAKKIKKYLSEDLTTILKALGVKDIILIDGTEIDLRYFCAANFGCQGKGRDRLDGDLQDLVQSFMLHIL